MLASELVLSILFSFSLLCFYFSQKIELELDLLTHQLPSGEVALLSFTFSLTVSFLKKNLLAMPHGMWDLSSLTRDGTHALCIGSMES